MIGTFVFDFIVWPVPDLMGYEGTANCDTLDDSVCENILLLPIIDLILNRR